MRNGSVSMFIKSVSVFIAVLMLSFNANAARPKYVPGEILVKFKTGVSESMKSSMRRSSSQQRAEPMFKAQLLKQIKSVSVERWRVDGGKSIEEMQQELLNDENVIYAEPNYYMYPHATPDDTFYTRQWGLNNTGQTIYGVTGIIGKDMEMGNAWDIQTGSSSVVVAVVDDGVTSHPDLDDNMLEGWNVLTGEAGAIPNLSNSPGSTHGTQVSGVIGAVGDNGVGIAGVAWDVSIMPILFSSDADGTGTAADAAEAFDYARGQSVDIVNFSYGSIFYSQTMADSITALESAGILMVVSAGNNEINNYNVPIYPSSLPNKNIISVAASNQLDNLASWTQYGPLSVDVMAPGENICTTRVGEEYACSQSIGADSYIDGTSFSAPYVAGVAALIKSEFPAADYQEIKGRIMAGVETQSTAEDKVASGGRVNAENALTVVATPVLVVNSISVDASGNDVIDPNETAVLAIGIENIWSDSTTVSATLSTTDSEISIASAAKLFGSIAKGGSASAIYSITLGDVSGHRVIPFQLDITAAGGYAVTRYFNLETGRLENNVEVSDVILADDYDNVHYYHFNVPDGSSSLTITSSSSNDIDLFSLPSQKPLVYSIWDKDEEFSIDGYYSIYNDADEENAAGFRKAVTESGDETITYSSPAPGQYWIAVYSYDLSSNTNYTIKVETKSSSGGGGAISIFSLLLMFGFGATLRIRKY